MKFYGREREKKSLRKTGIPSIYYECSQATEMNNVESLALLIFDLIA